MAAKPVDGPDLIFRRITAGFAVFAVVFEVYYFATARLPYDALHYVIGWDYLNTWMGAHATLFGQPRDYFNYTHYNAVLRELFPAAPNPHNWSYPPHILLLIWPFGLLPYLPSYVLWVAVGLAAFLWVGSDGKWDRERLAFLAFSPVVLVNILTGQNGLFTAAILIAALNNWDRRPALSGVLFGLMSVKPQLVLLVPLVLALTGRWRCMGFAALTCAAMAVLTTAIFGESIWGGYFALVAPFQMRVLEYGTGLMLTMMPTAFMNARLAGLPLGTAWILQALTSAITVALAVWTFRRSRDPLLATGVLLVALLLVTPYVFNYDMAALTIVLAKLRTRADLTGKRFILALWLLPVAVMLDFVPKIPGSFLVQLGFGVWLVSELRKEAAAHSDVSASVSASTVSITRTS